LFLEKDVMSMWYTHGEAGPEEIGREPWSGEWDRPDNEIVVNQDNTRPSSRSKTQLDIILDL
jgi:hypothetical protein